MGQDLRVKDYVTFTHMGVEAIKARIESQDESEPGRWMVRLTGGARKGLILSIPHANTKLDRRNPAPPISRGRASTSFSLAQTKLMSHIMKSIQSGNLDCSIISRNMDFQDLLKKALALNAKAIKGKAEAERRGG